MASQDVVLASAVVTLAAVDAPLPIELTALMMVGVVLHWALARQNRTHDEHDERIKAVEEELAATRQSKDIERQLKHAWRNEVAAMQAALAVMVPLAQKCSCGTMDPLLPVLERLAADRKEPA